MKKILILSLLLIIVVIAESQTYQYRRSPFHTVNLEDIFDRLKYSLKQKIGTPNKLVTDEGRNIIKLQRDSIVYKVKSLKDW